MHAVKRRSALVGGVVLTLALVAAACGSSGKSSTPTTTSGTSSSSSTVPAASVGALPANLNTYNATANAASKVSGGTVYWSAQPNYAPNYIFPMTNAQVCGTNNVEYLSALLYRPLYWFGNNNTPTIDYNYSIGKAPVFSD